MTEVAQDSSIETHLCLLDVSSALGRDVNEVDAPVVSDDRHAAVLSVEAYCLHVALQFDLRQAKVAIPVFIEHFHPGQSSNVIKEQYLPGFLVFDFRGLRQILVGEAVLAHLDALFNSLADLEDVDTLVRACAGNNVLSRMENDARDLGCAIAAFQLLDQFAAVAAKNLDNVAADRGRSDQGAVVVDGYGADLGGFVCDDAEIDALVDDYDVSEILLTKV